MQLVRFRSGYAMADLDRVSVQRAFVSAALSQWLTPGKLVRLRIFDDEAGVMNRDVVQVGGEVLVVSQFTLYADARRGNRPSFIEAARPEEADALYEEVVRHLREAGLPCGTGVFRADMQVELVNDGPVTLLIDSRRTF